jgi:hypothetical protein
VFEYLPKNKSEALGWRVDESHIAYINVGKIGVLWKSIARTSDSVKVRANYQRLTDGVVPRETFSVPTQSGVCLPYLFIADDGSVAFNVAMSYRLKSHPDVTIWLSESSAATYRDKGGEERLGPAYRIADFWAQYKLYDEKFTPMWSPLSTRPVRMNSSYGLASFMKINRRDQSEDFGYLAFVQGKPGQAQFVPELSLLVMRDSSKARSKGLAPVDEKTFLEMAEGIVSSIKRRPTR